MQDIQVDDALHLGGQGREACDQEMHIDLCGMDMEALEQLSDPADLEMRNRLNDRLGKEADPVARGVLMDEMHELTKRLEANVIKPLRAFRFHSSGFLLPLWTVGRSGEEAARNADAAETSVWLRSAKPLADDIEQAA